MATEGKSCCASVQVREVSDLVGPQVEQPGMQACSGQLCTPLLEEGAVDNQLTAALEQVEQARFALGPVEQIRLFHGNPRHPPALAGPRFPGAG